MYYYLGSSRVAMRQGSEVTYLHADHLGTVSLATNASQAVLARKLNMPYGSVRWASGAMPADYGFTGMKDTGLGLVYMHARYYAGYLNRWIQPDTIVPDPDNPQSLNRFSYVRNNPLKYTDPSGHREIECDPGTPGCDLNGRQMRQYDLTGYLAGAMTAHGGDPRIRQIAKKANRNPYPDEPFVGMFQDGFGLSWLGYELGTSGDAYPQFNELIGRKREWDIKQKMEQELGTEVILCGEVCDWYDYSTPGNIHFGYVAGLAGIDQGIAAFAGGILEQTENGIHLDYCNPFPLCDNPQDQAAVDFGYYLAGQYPNGITEADLRKELSVDWTSRFQRPLDPNWYPLFPPVSQPNQYGPDYFNYHP